MLKTTFGGGSVSPSVAVHLKKSAALATQKTGVSVPAAQFGGGSISPAVVSHLAKRKQFGGGSVSPLVAAHLAKRNIAKK